MVGRGGASDQLNSDTVAMTLVCVFYHLTRSPQHLEKVQRELDSIESIQDIQSLQSLPHLNGVINEALRLHPAVPTGGLRQTPPEGAYVSSRFVPGNTVICAPRYSLARRKCPFSSHST